MKTVDIVILNKNTYKVIQRSMCIWREVSQRRVREEMRNRTRQQVSSPGFNIHIHHWLPVLLLATMSVDLFAFHWASIESKKNENMKEWNKWIKKTKKAKKKHITVQDMSKLNNGQCRKRKNENKNILTTTKKWTIET